MSSDVEVYVEANIKDEVHQSTCWKGSVVCGPKERKYKSPPPSAKGINNLMCAAEPKARQSYYAHNLSVSHRPYTTMRRDDSLEYLGIYTNKSVRSVSVRSENRPVNTV